MGTQFALFETADRAVWRQLPEEAREQVAELLGRLLLKHAESQSAREHEVDDER